MKKRFLLPVLLSFLCLNSFVIQSNNSYLMSNKKSIRIAMAQIFCLDGDRSGNLLRIENAIKEAQAQQADMVLFPESSIFGWVNPVAHERATPIPGGDSDSLCQLAKKYDIHVCIGLDEKDGDELFDSAILIDNQGVILLKHRKINVLPDLMTPQYAVGKGVQTVQTQFGKVGLMICADSFQDDLLKEMAAQKPDLLLIPYGWAAPENKWPEHGKELQKVVQHAAKTVNCPVIGTDLIGQISHGPWTGQIYGGQSVAANAKGDIIAVGKDRERDILIFNVDL
jgi:predicted amidohydrolase